MRKVIFFLFVYQSLLFASWQSELEIKIKTQIFPSWMSEQIDEDLSRFKAVGFSDLDVWKTVWLHPGLDFILGKVKDGKFSWSSYPSSQNKDFRVEMFVNSFQQLADAVKLPDVFFAVFVGESFCEPGQAPILSWCKHEKWGKVTVLLPDYEALSGNSGFLKSVQQGKALYPWEKKQNKAFWRGATTGGWGFEFNPRLKLAELSSHFPQLLDAKFSGIFQSQYDNIVERNQLFPYVGDSCSVKDHLQYKYQILVDGHVSAFSRYYWQLFSDCVIFKHDSPWYQWFYRALRPYEHYIPYKADASDLIDKILWAMQNEDRVRQIIYNANEFAAKELTHADVMLYVYLLLNKYAELQQLSAR